VQPGIHNACAPILGEHNYLTMITTSLSSSTETNHIYDLILCMADESSETTQVLVFPFSLASAYTRSHVRHLNQSVAQRARSSFKLTSPLSTHFPHV
jgi:hypothetical protein